MKKLQNRIERKWRNGHKIKQINKNRKRINNAYKEVDKNKQKGTE